MSENLGFRFLTLNDIVTKEKTIFVRVDVNSPLDPTTKEIIDDTRIRMTRETLESLEDAKVVVGSHQGRPGDEDFTSLETHAKLLQNHVPQRVKFIQDTIGPEARHQIRNLKVGEILVLDNLRLCSEENISAPPDTLAKTIMVQRLAGLLDVYVNDAFATAHRSQASIVGLPRLVQAVAGKLMARELEALKQAYYSPRRPSVYVIGGAKAEDKLPIIENILRTGKADRVLVGGVVANVFLRASGIDFGQGENRKLEKSAILLEKARVILTGYKDKVVLPKDLAILRDGKGSKGKTSGTSEGRRPVSMRRSSSSRRRSCQAARWASLRTKGSSLEAEPCWKRWPRKRPSRSLVADIWRATQACLDWTPVSPT
jgi:phosphoglycerate kinase